MMCRDCRAVFDADDGCAVYDRVPYGEREVHCDAGIVCPQCGSTNVDEEHECRQCERECSSHELDEGLCRLCVEETTEALGWLWNSLTPAQRAWACEHTEWMTA